jgi:VWFA-related protein
MMRMKRFTFACLSFAILLTAVNAQSGRRIKTRSTPSPKTVAGVKVIDPNVYSESRPFKPVLLRPGRRKKSKQKPKVVETKTVATAEGEDEIISVDASLVNIPVSVFDKNGIYVPHIQKKEFKIFEDGVEQEISYFGTNDQPFTVALMIDTSGSTQFKIEDIHWAAKLFARQLEPQDRMIVIQFSSGVRVNQEATNDKDKIDRAIEKAKFGGSTSLYRAVEFTLKKRMNKIKGRKAIVLFSDGVDTSRWRNGYQDNFEDAEESDTLIYPVFYNTFLGSLSGGTVMGAPPILGGGVRDARAQTFGKSYLEQLASFTGGRMFEAGRSRSLLFQAFEGIAEELRTQYNIGYSPITEGEKGERKRIKVRVYRPDLRVRARDSYIVGEAQKTAGAN